MISKETAIKFVQGLFSEVWCERNKDAVFKYYHLDFLGLLHGEEEFRLNDVLKRVDYNKAHYLDPKCTFHDIFSVDDRIIARVTMTVIDKKTQKPNTFHFMIIIEMKEGKMYRQWTLSSQTYRYKDWQD